MNFFVECSGLPQTHIDNIISGKRMHSSHCSRELTLFTNCFILIHQGLFCHLQVLKFLRGVSSCSLHNLTEIKLRYTMFWYFIFCITFNIYARLILNCCMTILQHFSIYFFYFLIFSRNEYLSRKEDNYYYIFNTIQCFDNISDK